MRAKQDDQGDQPLEHFDALRREDPAAALAGYARLMDQIGASDADRLGWICRQDLRNRLDLEPLLVRAWESDADAHLRRRVVGTLGLIAQEQGRGERAKSFFEQTLAIARDQPDDAWLRACLNLSLTFSRERRELESLILVRRAVDVAQDLGDAKWLAFAWKRYCGLLVMIEDVERLQGALVQADRAVATLPDGPAANIAAIELLFARAELARMHGDPEMALALLDSGRARIDAAPGRTLYRNALRVHGANCLLELGRRGLAQTSLAGLEQPVGPDQARIARLYEIRCMLLTARHDAALALATDAIHELESEPAGIALYEALPLGRDLAAGRRAPFLARRALEVAAQALLRRVAEVDDCMRRLPEMQHATPDVPEILADYRARLATKYGDLLSVVAQDLVHHLTAHEDAGDGDERIAVCAWCRFVRAPNDRWLPIAHFVPPSVEMRVSHGICPRCAARELDDEPGAQESGAS